MLSLLHRKIVFKKIFDHFNNVSFQKIKSKMKFVNVLLHFSGQTIEVPRGTFKLDTYKMDHENRGRALIINNRTFAKHLKMTDRTGSDVDASAIYQRLQELGFDCELLNDATESQILHKLKECMLNIILCHIHNHVFVIIISSCRVFHLISIIHMCSYF